MPEIAVSGQRSAGVVDRRLSGSGCGVDLTRRCIIATEMDTNTLYYGDNLPILRKREYYLDGSAHLIYLDPPD